MSATATTLIDAARDLLLRYPHVGVDRAYQMALEANPALALAHHHGDQGVTTPPAAGLSPAEPELVDPGQLIAEHAAAGGLTFAAACKVLPNLAAAYHRAEMVARPKPPSAPPGPIILRFRAPIAGEALRRVPIFKAGSWNGRSYGAADLAAMVKAHEAGHWLVPLSLGHAAAPDAPAVGRVSKLWVEGDTLLADFADVDPDVLAGIKAGKWLSLSCEVYLNIARNGTTYSAALRSIALLGAHPPGVDLPPLAAALGGRA